MARWRAIAEPAGPSSICARGCACGAAARADRQARRRRHRRGRTARARPRPSHESGRWPGWCRSSRSSRDTASATSSMRATWRARRNIVAAGGACTRRQCRPNGLRTRCSTAIAGATRARSGMSTVSSSTSGISAALRSRTVGLAAPPRLVMRSDSGAELSAARHRAEVGWSV